MTPPARVYVPADAGARAVRRNTRHVGAVIEPGVHEVVASVDAPYATPDGRHVVLALQLGADVPVFVRGHAAWALGYQQHSRHEVTLLTLPDRFWKWRMHGGAVTLARRFREQRLTPNVMLPTDMVVVTTCLGLSRDQARDIPLVLIMQVVADFSPLFYRDTHISISIERRNNIP